MSAAATTPPTHTSTYIEEALESLQKHNKDDTALCQTADDCLSCMTTVKDDQGEKHRRQQAKSRLIPSKYNTLGATHEHDLREYESKCVFRALAANFLCSAMSQADKDTLENDHGVDWQTALRLSGPLKHDGTSPLHDSTFAKKVSDDRYDVLSFNHEGELSDKIFVGREGLYDRLGLCPTRREKEMRETHKVLDPALVDLDSPLGWIQAQDLEEFSKVHIRVAAAFRKDAKELRSILGMPGVSLGRTATTTAKHRLWDGNLNHQSLRSRSPLHHDSIWVFKRMAGVLAGRALMSCASQADTASELRSKVPNWSQLSLLRCNNGAPDISSSKWFCPANPEVSSAVDSIEEKFLLLSVEDSKIRSRQEVTAAEMIGTLAVMGASAGATSSQKGKRKSTGAGLQAGAAASARGSGSAKKSRPTK